MTGRTGRAGTSVAAHARHRGPRLTRTAVAAFGVACLAVAAVTTSGAAVTWEQPSEVLAAGVGGLPQSSMGLQGWRHDASAEAAAGGIGTPGAPGAAGGTGSGVWGDVGVGVDDLDDWDDWATWEGGAPGEDPFGDPFEIPGFEDPLAAAVPAGLAQGDIPAPSVRAYRAAAAVLAREAPGCGIDWALLAGIGRVESNHGRYGGAVVTTEGVSVPGIYGPRLDGSLPGTMVIRDTDGGALDGDPVYDRAVGPMQFIPSTWARWGSDGDRDGVKNPQDIDDAALAAARYLCSGGSDVTGDGVSAAVRRYNNSTEYVNLVLATAQGYRDGTVSAAPAYSGPVTGQPGPPGWTPPSVVYPGAPATGGTGSTPTQPAVRPSPPATSSPRPADPTSRPTTRPTTRPGQPTTGQPSTGQPSTGQPSTGRPTTAPTRPSTGSPSPSPTPTDTSKPTPTPTDTGTPTPTPTPTPTDTATPTPTPTDTATPTPTPSDPQPSPDPTACVEGAVYDPVAEQWVDPEGAPVAACPCGEGGVPADGSTADGDPVPCDPADPAASALAGARKD